MGSARGAKVGRYEEDDWFDSDSYSDFVGLRTVDGRGREPFQESNRGDRMILSTPNYTITYHAINKKGQQEDAVVLSSTKDLAPILERDGYKQVEIIEVR